MSHERLIAQLARDVAPVTPLPSPAIRAARWMLLAVCVVAVGVVFRGLRANWMVAAGDPVFIITTGLILATGVTSTVLAMALSVPGVVTTTWVRWTPVLLLAMWGGVLVFEIVSTSTSLAGARFGVSCLWKTYSIAAVPAAALVWLARRAAPLDWRATGSLAALAALSFGVLGTELICPISGHVHLFSWHFVPVLVMAVVVFIATSLGHRAFRR
jgi:hypothetical protein